MADYFEQTVVQQTIPTADITPLERLLLSRIFECERDGDGWYFFAEQSPSTMIYATREELEAVLVLSPDVASAAHLYVTEQLAAADATEMDLDLSGTSWEFFFQDIVKRSTTLAYVSIVAAFTCSKMRPDGFGGMAILITRDAIVGKSTTTCWRTFSPKPDLTVARRRKRKPRIRQSCPHQSERPAGTRASPEAERERAAGLAHRSLSESPGMSEYIVKIGFWLRACDGFTVEADSDAQAIEKAKAAAKAAMESGVHPEHIDVEERREGVIAFIDRVAPDGRRAVAEDVEFDDDRIHGSPTV